jgi:signal transduction histidine kinase
MLVAGASGYVLKDSDGDDILDAIRQAASGHGLLSPEVTPTVIDELTEALERERRRARQLEIAQQALLERAAQRHELVARLSHEIRTPVTVILATAQLMDRGMMPEEQKPDAIRILAERSEGLARLLDRFEAAVESGLTEWADVNGVAGEVAAAHDRVDVEQSDGPAMATLNRAAARRILEELVENALAFSPEDRPVLVKVGLRGGVAEVRVVDRGAGIEPSAAGRIFDALEQEEDLHTRTHQGVGFGLTLARMSARTMDGDVVLESSGPEGSTFLWIVSGVPAQETAGGG